MLRTVLAGLAIWSVASSAAAYSGHIYVDRNAIGSLLLIGSIVALIVWAVRAAREKPGLDGLPPEFRTDDSAEDYDAQATRLRALKRKLDAEAELTESYINAELARGKLDEVAEILRHDRARRSAGGR